MNWQEVVVTIIFWEVLKYIALKWWREIFNKK